MPGWSRVSRRIASLHFASVPFGLHAVSNHEHFPLETVFCVCVSQDAEKVKKKKKKKKWQQTAYGH